MSRKKKTTESFIEEISQKNPNILILGEYINSSTKIKAKCKTCEHEWDVLPSSLSRDYGCPKCSIKGINKNSQERFEEKLKESNCDYIPLENYTKCDDKIRCKCKHCGNIKSITARYLMQGCKCVKCNSDRNFTTLKEKIETISEQYIILSDTYNSTDDVVKIKCKKCGHTSKRKIQHIYNAISDGQICRKCWAKIFAENQSDTIDSFLEKLNSITSEIEIIGDYISSNTKIKCKCKKCGKEWSATPNSLLCGSGCPKCHASRGETKIEMFLSNHNIEYVPQMKFDGLYGIGNRLLKFDFYLPTYNLLIEYQGEFHDGLCNSFVKKRVSRTVEHDKRKKIFCNSNNIELLEIWYWDYKNIEDILTNKLLNEKSRRKI